LECGKRYFNILAFFVDTGFTTYANICSFGGYKAINEESKLSEKIGQLKIKSSDGKAYMTDVADAGQLFTQYAGSRCCGRF